MSEDVSSKVKKIVADHLGIDEAKVTEESSFIDDLGADSLDTVELVMAFEEEFGSEISDSEAEKIDDKFKEFIISKIPSARLGEPDDIANAVLFLSSYQSNYINGETLHVNGGMYMAWQNSFLNY